MSADVRANLRFVDAFLCAFQHILSYRNARIRDRHLCIQVACIVWALYYFLSCNSRKLHHIPVDYRHCSDCQSLSIKHHAAVSTLPLACYSPTLIIRHKNGHSTIRMTLTTRPIACGGSQHQCGKDVQYLWADSSNLMASHLYGKSDNNDEYKQRNCQPRCSSAATINLHYANRATFKA